MRGSEEVMFLSGMSVEEHNRRILGKDGRQIPNAPLSVKQQSPLTDAEFERLQVCPCP